MPDATGREAVIPWGNVGDGQVRFVAGSGRALRRARCPLSAQG